MQFLSLLITACLVQCAPIPTVGEFFSAQAGKVGAAFESLATKMGPKATKIAKNSAIALGVGGLAAGTFVGGEAVVNHFSKKSSQDAAALASAQQAPLDPSAFATDPSAGAAPPVAPVSTSSLVLPGTPGAQFLPTLPSLPVAQSSSAAQVASSASPIPQQSAVSQAPFMPSAATPASMPSASMASATPPPAFNSATAPTAFNSAVTPPPLNSATAPTPLNSDTASPPFNPATADSAPVSAAPVSSVGFPIAAPASATPPVVTSSAGISSVEVPFEAPAPTRQSSSASGSV